MLEKRLQQEVVCCMLSYISYPFVVKFRRKGLGLVSFTLYVLALVYFLFFSEKYGRAVVTEQEFRYNLVPFVEIRRFWVYRKQLGFAAVFTNLVCNVAGFLPFGFILPVITEKMRSGLLITLAGFGLSLTVEVIQLITRVGCFDVDDLFMNTIGGLLGYICYYIIYGRQRSRGTKKRA